MTYGYATIAAENFYKNGLFDVYQLPEPERSLHKGINWVVKEAFEHKDLIAVEKHGRGTKTLGWTEIYRARFPDKPVSKLIQKKLKRPAFLNMIGGSTTCLFFKKLDD